VRIGFVYDAAYPWVNGGAERRYHELAKRLATRHEVHYVTWRHWEGAEDIVRDNVHHHGLGDAPQFYGQDGKRTVAEALSFSARLAKFIARQRWDVVDCSATPYLPLYAMWIATRWSGVPFVATWHEFWGQRWKEYLPRRTTVAKAAMRIESGSRGLGDALVAVSEFTARELGSTSPSKAIQVVPNGVSLDEIRAVPKQQRNIDLVYLGRLIDEKRVDLLVKAVHRLRPTLSQLRCVIIGDGPERQALEALARSLGVDAQIEFRRSLDTRESIALLKSATALVQPSAREGFGMSVIEAQACGTVPIVVAGRWSAATELVEDGVNGLVCQPTADSIADAVMRLVSNPVRRASMAAAAERAAASFDWDEIADTMEKIYVEHAMKTRSALLGKPRCS
jgi:glycosyltransferase involved in cell wall biosynthesis